MSLTESTESPAAPKRKPAKKRARARAKRSSGGGSPPAPKDTKWSGATRTACPSGCTGEHCLVSTVNVCKHPYMTGDAGCGPITNKNRDALRRYLKHQDADRG